MKKKKNRKNNLLLSDLIGPVVAISNIIIMIFYFMWNILLEDNKTGAISYILVYILIFISVLLLVISIVSLVRLSLNKVEISKSLKKDKLTFSVVGVVLGLMILLFSNSIAEHIAAFNEPVRYCDETIVREYNK